MNDGLVCQCRVLSNFRDLTLKSLGRLPCVGSGSSVCFAPWARPLSSRSLQKVLREVTVITNAKARPIANLKAGGVGTDPRAIR